jgi:ankyrin repeat protein
MYSGSLHDVVRESQFTEFKQLFENMISELGDDIANAITLQTDDEPSSIMSHVCAQVDSRFLVYTLQRLARMGLSNKVVNCKDSDGLTVLFCAVALREYRVVMLLISHGADVEGQEVEGRSIVNFAPDQRMREILLCTS